MRSLLPVVILVLAVAALPAAIEGGDLTDQQVLDRLANEQPRDAAIRRGLAWLRSQARDDGALAESEHRVALTALAVMAHLASGHAVHDPEHGAWMQRGVQAVLAGQDANGYFGARDNSRMYGHGIATLAVAEALGMCDVPALDERLRAALEKAVAVTVNAADPAKVRKEAGHEGGWRYQPHDTSSDLSLSGWQIMSLHACQQVGIRVPAEVVQRACAYARRLTDDEGRVGYDKRGQDHPALRGLGLICFALEQKEQDPLADKVAARIVQHPIAWEGPWLYYRAYYDAVGLSRLRPEAWERYRAVLEGVLLPRQHQEGFWPGPPGDNEARFSHVYTTSMAILALAVERHVLPAYQR